MAESSSGYVFPAWFVNTVIASILAAIVTIGGYMWRWNAEDARLKAVMGASLGSLTKAVDTLVHKLDGIDEKVPVLDARVTELDRRLDRLEDRSRRD